MHDKVNQDYLQHLRQTETLTFKKRKSKYIEEGCHRNTIFHPDVSLYLDSQFQDDYTDDTDDYWLF
jgi:hypothetical protein